MVRPDQSLGILNLRFVSDYIIHVLFPPSFSPKKKEQYQEYSLLPILFFPDRQAVPLYSQCIQEDTPPRCQIPAGIVGEGLNAHTALIALHYTYVVFSIPFGQIFHFRHKSRILRQNQRHKSLPWVFFYKSVV